MGKLWAITCFFNAAGYKAPLRNFRVFSESLARQGVPLLTVELAFKDRPFVLPDDTPNLHRLRGQSVLWQKERLLNHALHLLPAECDKVAWVDADILWPDATWVERTNDALDRRHHVVQLFEGAFRLFPEQEAWTCTNPHGQPLWWEPGSAFHLTNGWSWEHTCMGFAWAARREWLSRVGLYERCVLGGGDFVMLNALFRRDHHWGHQPLDDDIAAWAGRVRESAPSVGYVAGTVCHLFHGNVSKRRYTDRHLILQENGYRPATDIFCVNHAWEWATLKPDLHAAVADYFLGRKEDEGWVDETALRDSFVLGEGARQRTRK